MEDVRSHDNQNQGIGGTGSGLVVRDSELDNNGMRKFTAADAKDSEPISSVAGVKSVNSMTITSSYIHDNWWNGIWCDVYRHDLPVQNNTYINLQDNMVKNNGKIGISDEVCKTARISGNRIIHNGYNLEATTTRSGILVSGLQDAEVFDNVVRYNKRYGIKLVKNHRATSPTIRVNVYDNTVSDNEINLLGCDLAGVTSQRNGR